MNEKSGGIGVVSVLTIVFIVLKLCGVINWSWVWVLSPIWITVSFIVAILIIIAIIVTIHMWYLKLLDKKF